MKNRSLAILCFLIISAFCFSQEKGYEAELSIDERLSTDSIITFKLLVKNNSREEISLFHPKEYEENRDYIPTSWELEMFNTNKYCFPNHYFDRISWRESSSEKFITKIRPYEHHLFQFTFNLNHLVCESDATAPNIKGLFSLSLNISLFLPKGIKLKSNIVEFFKE